MKYGQITGNKSISELIYRCFDTIHEMDARIFVKKFNEQLHDNTQVMHTLRELVLGAYLGVNSLDVRYNKLIDTSTPDWCILDKTEKPAGIVELTNFHVDAEVQVEIEKARQDKGRWVGWLPNNEKRLYQIIWYKARKYRALIQKYHLPYVIAVFGDVTAALDMSELQSSVFHTETGLFTQYPTTSGVLHFEERPSGYAFTYLQNPYADKELQLQDGLFL